NGLKVIVHEDHDLPKAVVNLIYRVGSKDESPEQTGFAHLFEHLMFRGSINIPAYDTALQRVGGSNNAFTSADITNYYISLPSNQLETAFWLESDRMLGLNFTEENLEAEKSVVIEEYKQRYLNQPYGNAFLELRPLHYQVHPYQWMPIGKEVSHIADASMQDVQDFFFSFYAPNNATLVVAGDVTFDQVQKLTNKWFGDIPKRALGKRVLPQEPTQNAPRQKTISGKVPFPAVYRMYHIPAYGTREYFIADLITDLLASGKSSLFYQHLVRGLELSPSVNAYVLPMHEPGSMVLVGQIAEGKSIEAFEKGLDETIERLYDLKEDDLDRIKAKLEAAYTMQQTTILNRAIGLAMSEVVGDVDLVNNMMAIYHSIELSEVKAEAKRIFSPSNCSTLYYHPE
ncbi:MAG: M16 family metallopeptidase, partial [Bacteroidia bacterium]